MTVPLENLVLFKVPKSLKSFGSRFIYLFLIKMYNKIAEEELFLNF